LAATHPERAASALAAIGTALSCATTTACVTGANSGAGPGVSASSATGPGLQASSSKANAVSGSTIAGTAGVAGKNASSVGYGVYGYNSARTGSAVGVYGLSLGGSSTGVGVLGSGAVGVEAEANAKPTGALIGQLPIALYASAHTLATAEGYESIGIESESDAFPLEAFNTVDGTTLDLAARGDLIYGFSSSGSFYIDGSGNENLSGTLTTSKGVYLRTKGASGATRLAYGARTTAPAIEDVGESQLTNGRAVVSFDTALADSIDTRAGYHVFVTPEADCNGLYVAQKTHGGFVVRELHAGRSSLRFEYRVVAKPADEVAARLPAAAPPERRESPQSAFGHPGRP
jgi:hypothetical protein